MNMSNPELLSLTDICRKACFAFVLKPGWRGGNWNGNGIGTETRRTAHKSAASASHITYCTLWGSNIAIVCCHTNASHSGNLYWVLALSLAVTNKYTQSPHILVPANWIRNRSMKSTNKRNGPRGGCAMRNGKGTILEPSQRIADQIDKSPGDSLWHKMRVEHTFMRFLNKSFPCSDVLFLFLWSCPK